MNSSSRRCFLGTCSTLAGGAILSRSLDANTEIVEKKSAEATEPANAECSQKEEIGRPYIGWKEGEMDLHFILTGVGESMFHIYPDGTTLLLDAADRDIVKYKENVPAKPDASRLGSEWIMRYLLRVNPGEKSIDYMMLSHYHEDHAGSENVHAGKTVGRGDDYFLSGLANVGEYFSFNTVFDRGWPQYDQPVLVKNDGFVNFVKFTKYMHAAGRLRMEEFEVGRQNQLALRKNPEKYPTFRTRNICRNGVVWTGKEGECRNFYEDPESLKGWLNENSLSLGLTIEYGPFRYFTGGDLSGKIMNAQHEDQKLDAFVGQVVGPLDVCKTNHHSYKDAMTEGFTSAVQARVYVSNVWDLHHLQDNTMRNMTEAAENVLVCPTIVHEKAWTMYQDQPWMKSLAPESRQGGHVVVKVFDGGRQYKVYYLTAEDESMVVRNIYGPFTSRSAS